MIPKHLVITPKLGGFLDGDRRVMTPRELEVRINRTQLALEYLFNELENACSCGKLGQCYACQAVNNVKMGGRR